MSIIKRYNIFNEELRSNTYSRASVALKKMGHIKRSKELEDYSNIVRNREAEETIRKNYEDMSRFPSFRLKLVEDVHDEHPIIGDFYIKMWLSSDWFSNTIDTWQIEKVKDGTPKWDISAPFSVGIIPVDEDLRTTMRTDEYFDECRSTGIYYTNEMFIYITSGCMIPNKVPAADLTGPIHYSKSRFYFADRKEAIKFKTMLLDGFEGRIKLWDDGFHPDGMPKSLYEHLSEEEKYWRNGWRWKDEYGNDRQGTDNPPIVADVMYQNAITSIKNMKINDLYID